MAFRPRNCRFSASGQLPDPIYPQQKGGKLMYGLKSPNGRGRPGGTEPDDGGGRDPSHCPPPCCWWSTRQDGNFFRPKKLRALPMGRSRSRSFRLPSLVSSRRLTTISTSGVLDMTLSPASLMDKKWPAIRHMDLPFLWGSFEHFERGQERCLGRGADPGHDGQFQHAHRRHIRLWFP